MDGPRDLGDYERQSAFDRFFCNGFE